MRDRIKELEEQAKVILEWCRQQQLPEDERDILEFKKLLSSIWERVIETSWNLDLGKFRLRKRPKKHTATLYWYRDINGSVFASFSKPRTYPTIGTSTVEFTESQE